MPILDLERHRTLIGCLPIAVKPRNSAACLTFTKIGIGPLPQGKVIQIEFEAFLGKSVFPFKPTWRNVAWKVGAKLRIG